MMKHLRLRLSTSADELVTHMIGTLGFACPGMVYAAVGRWQPIDLEKADAFSAGCTLYQLLTGRLLAPLSGLAQYCDYAEYYDRLVSKRLTGQSHLTRNALCSCA